ncbi:hypothetical protein PA598K_06657 [Paenibacillus sp. 598K]|nr:hypothetical protein PA598K_06657 [Paenibacillus sp. 598K]
MLVQVKKGIAGGLIALLLFTMPGMNGTIAADQEERDYSWQSAPFRLAQAVSATNLAAKAQAANLLTNGSFEANTGTTGIANGWTNIYTTAQTVSSSVTSGQKAQRLTASKIGKGYYVGMSQRVKIDGGKPYVANANVNITKLEKADVYLYMDFLNSAGEWVGNSSTSYSSPTGGKYVTLTANGTLPAKAAFAEVYIMVKGNADLGSVDLLVDQMNLRYDWDANLLTNPGFESFTSPTGVADGWSKIVSGDKPAIQVVAQSAEEGTRAHRISDANLYKDGMSGIYQNVKMNGNATYNLSALFNATSLKKAKVQLYIDFLNSKHEYIGNQSTDSTVLQPNLSMSLNGKTPANTAYAVVYILVRSTEAGGSGAFTVDMANLSYTATPNKLTNPSFEIAGSQSQLAAGWRKEGKGISLATAPVSAGGKAQKISGTLSSGERAYIYQSVKVKAGDPYFASANVYVESLKNAQVRYQIIFFDAANQVVLSNSFANKDVSKKYQQMYFDKYVVPDKAVRANVIIMLEPTAAQGSGTVYIDDVRFQ